MQTALPSACCRYVTDVRGGASPELFLILVTPRPYIKPPHLIVCIKWDRKVLLFPGTLDFHGYEHYSLGPHPYSSGVACDDDLRHTCVESLSAG